MSQNQYLQRRHQTWYVVVEVPKPQRAVVGKARLIRSLKTQSLQEAGQLKHAVVAEFKRRLEMIAKLKAARDRKRAETGKCGGRLTYAERDGGPELVARAKALKAQRPRLSLRKIAAVLKGEGKTTPN